MNNDQLLDRYLVWLEPHTGVLEQSRTYHDLLRLLMAREFLWFVPNDDNRIEDGLEVRREFKAGIRDLWPPSVLEVIVALSRRLSFAADGPAPMWAWQLITNLELHKMWDPLRRRKEIAAEEILDNLIYRTYQPDGYGGFFPLIDAGDADQRKVEIWYQMAAFVEEIHMEYHRR